REGTPVVRDERRLGPVRRQARPHVVPAARARGRGQLAPRPVHGRAVPGHRRRRRIAVALRPGEHAGALLMRVLVFVKRGPETGARITLTPDERAIDTSYLGFTISPHEECAVEEAIRIAAAHDASTTVLTLGPPEAVEQLQNAIAMGIGEAKLLEAEGDWGPQATAAAIASTVQAQAEPFDLLLFGNESADNGNYQVAVRVAVALGLPCVTGVK